MDFTTHRKPYESKRGSLKAVAGLAPVQIPFSTSVSELIGHCVSVLHVFYSSCGVLSFNRSKKTTCCPQHPSPLVCVVDLGWVPTSFCGLIQDPLTAQSLTG